VRVPDKEHAPPLESEQEDDEEGELEELDDKEMLMMSLQKGLKHELDELRLLTAYETVAKMGLGATAKDWVQAERRITSRGTYTGQAPCTKSQHAREKIEKEKADAASCARYVGFLLVS
jgi:hypothetical protein